MPLPPLPVDDLEHVLSRTRELWEEARGERFFITGGTGFFGMWLLETFAYVNDALGLGMKATVLTRHPEAFELKAPHLTARHDLQFISGDIRGFSFPAGKFPFVVHAATEASVKLNAENPREMFDSIVSGANRMLEFAAQAGVRKFLLTSSGAIYGRQPSELTHVPETYNGTQDPLLSSSAYGIGKLAAEFMCAIGGRLPGVEVKIARCFAFVGPHLPLDGEFAVGNFIRDAMRGNTIHVSGDGTAFRSYLYAADLAVWLWTLLFKAPSGRAYNVGSDVDLTISELAHTVSSVFGRKSNVHIAQSPIPGKPAARYVPDVRRGGAELGLRVETDLKAAIGKTVLWLGGDPNGVVFARKTNID